jgi:hypothetical protein
MYLFQNPSHSYDRKLIPGFDRNGKVSTGGNPSTVVLSKLIIIIKMSKSIGASNQSRA